MGLAAAPALNGALIGLGTVFVLRNWPIVSFLTGCKITATGLDRWQVGIGSKRSNFQLFVTQLYDLLDLPPPDPASKDNDQNAYVFERRVDFHNSDGTSNWRFIDCYRRGAFIVEGKNTGKDFATGTWDDAMLRAHGQAIAYARALPQTEGRPPFAITLDARNEVRS